MQIPTRFAIVVAILVALGSPSPGAPYPREQMRLILLPIDTNIVNGAFSTTWWAEIRVHNQSEQDVPFHLGHSFCGQAFCREVIRAGETRELLMPRHAGNVRGQLAYADRAVADKLTFSYHTWVSFGGRSRPVAEIPVVSEEELETDRLVLPHVPLDPFSRVTLRIYDANPTRGSTVMLRIFPAEGSSTVPEPLVEELLYFQYYVVGGDDALSFPASPGSIELISLERLYPQLASRDAIRIEVEASPPHEDGLALWMFATVTDNTTNGVVNYTPNRAANAPLQ